MNRKLTAAASLALLCLVLCFSFFYNLSKNPLQVWDEGRRATDALQMYRTGEWIITFYDNNPQTWGTKSPLLLWLQVASMHVFGVNEWAIRFPSVFAACLVAVVVWHFARRHLGNAWVGFLAGSVFAGTYAWVANHAGRSADYDALLTLFTTLYCFCFYLYCVHQHTKWLRWFCFFITLAAFTKGVVSLFFVPGLLFFALTQKKLKALFTNRWLYIGVLFFIFFIGSYYALRELHTPGFLKAVYGNELGGRFLQGIEGNGNPFFYYLKNMKDWRYNYWLPFLLVAFLYGGFGRTEKVRRLTLFHLCITVSFLLVISASKTKLYWYDLPVYPFFSLQIGILLYGAWELVQRKLTTGRLHWSFQAMAAAALFFLLFYKPYRRVKTHNNYVYHEEPWTFDIPESNQAWYLKEAVDEGKDLNRYVFFYTAPSHHLKFYVTRLQMKKVDVRLAQTADSILPGHHVVISQPELLPALQQHYVLKKEETAHNCAVYLVEGLRNATPAITHSGSN